jgi:hypothetical protein
MAGCDRSAAPAGARGEARLAHAQRAAQWSTSLWRVRGLGQVGLQQFEHQRCDFSARSLSVLHLHARRGVRQHDGASVRSPATSTTQARQLPAGVQAGLVAQVRDLDAFARATSKIVSLARPATARPFEREPACSRVAPFGGDGAFS